MVSKQNKPSKASTPSGVKKAKIIAKKNSNHNYKASDLSFHKYREA